MTSAPIIIQTNRNVHIIFIEHRRHQLHHVCMYVCKYVNVTILYDCLVAWVSISLSLSLSIPVHHSGCYLCVCMYVCDFGSTYKVSWEDMLKQNIQPPWIPKIPNRVTSEYVSATSSIIYWILIDPSYKCNIVKPSKVWAGYVCMYITLFVFLHTLYRNFVKWDLDTPSGHSPPKVRFLVLYFLLPAV